MIPQIIHQTWRDKSLPNILDNIYKYNVNINKNNKFEFKLWSHAPGEPEIDILLKTHYPELYDIFNKTKFGVQKGDIGRLAILYHYGGIYIDLDILCLKPFDNLIDFNSNKLIMANEPKEQTMKVFNDNNYLCNAFIATPSKHPILKSAMENIISLHKKFGDVIFDKFDIFGGGYIKSIINITANNSELFQLIDTDIVYPINDPKFYDLGCSKKDWGRLKNGYYGSKAILVHLWIHCDFEGKKLLDKFVCNNDISIHDNIFKFFSELYPQNVLLAD
jgi:hypothetical protein